MRMFWLSIHPSSRKPCWNALRAGVSAEAPERTPSRWTLPVGCVLTPVGQDTAPPASARNSRRLTHHTIHIVLVIKISALHTNLIGFCIANSTATEDRSGSSTVVQRRAVPRHIQLPRLPRRRRCPPCAQVQTHAAQQRSDYSMTSSARAMSVGEIVRPNAFAVLRLMMSSRCARDRPHRNGFLSGSCAGRPNSTGRHSETFPCRCVVSAGMRHLLHNVLAAYRFLHADRSGDVLGSSLHINVFARTCRDRARPACADCKFVGRDVPLQT